MSKECKLWLSNNPHLVGVRGSSTVHKKGEENTLIIWKLRKCLFLGNENQDGDAVLRFTQTGYNAKSTQQCPHRHTEDRVPSALEDRREGSHPLKTSLIQPSVSGATRVP